MKMPVSKLSLFFSLLMLVFSCQDRTSRTDRHNASPAENTWKVIGPGGGGGVMKPTISPFDESFVMTHCDMTAAYLTLDGGLTR
jgi:hypothetical protein